jgi:tRNA pseudouridine55 synthase
VVIDKPTGCTSHDVVDQVRKALGTRKVGHAGTLDPDATGVLVLGVGIGTKLLEYTTGSDKTYTGEVVFGTETSTLDAAGEVTAVHDMDGLEPGRVKTAAAGFLGDIEQIPPMVSAVKVDGKRLHELARQGIEVERKARPVTVHRYDVEPTDDPLVYHADVSCSSGTYVRTLAADLGTALGGGAHLRNLRRTSVGSIHIDQAQALDRFDLQPIELLVGAMPILEVDAAVAERVGYGQKLPFGNDAGAAGRGRLAIKGPDGTLLAVYEVRHGQLCPSKVLVGR